MKNIYFVIIVIFFLSCKSAKIANNGDDCIENTQFKKKFFYHLNYIEDYMFKSQDSLFRVSVTFISNYAPISTNTLRNYGRTYPSGVFEKDRVNILKWYEENKCNNIQVKSSHIIPDAYRN